MPGDGQVCDHHLTDVVERRVVRAVVTNLVSGCCCSDATARLRSGPPDVCHGVGHAAGVLGPWKVATKLQELDRMRPVFGRRRTSVRETRASTMAT